MRIYSVSVQGLFDTFNHQVVLKQTDRVTILHGPNGFGKTAILRLISGMFERRYHTLRAIPFREVVVRLENGQEVRVEQQTDRKSGQKEIQFLHNGKSWVCPPLSIKALGFPAEMIDEVVPGLRRFGPDAWQDIHTGETLHLDMVVERFADRLPANPTGSDETPDWLREIQEQVDVYFIRATRLERPSEDRPSRYYSPHGRFRDTSEPAVEAYSRQIARHIQAVLSRYAELSQSLDRTFPVRIVQSSSNPTSPTVGEVEGRLKQLEARREELTVAGLLDKEEHQLSALPAIDPSKLDVLGVYIEDVEKKLDVFSGLSKRIELFTEMINKRFQFKRVEVDRKNGLIFRTHKGDLLAPTQLSTGEQHEVVMLFQLLFDVREDALILVDEPEISLHVAWQELFLKDLTQISAVSNVDFLIATHSPQIISNRWDLTIELVGPN